MSDSPSKKFVLIGLPSTGKTSFLAALWYLLHHAQVEHRLTLDRMADDNRYLNDLSRLWAKCEIVPRTSTDAEQTVTMLLKDSATGGTITLTFPDLSGESFNLQWVERHFTANYDKFLRESTGGILFISPLKYDKPVRIDAAASLIKEMGAAGGDEGDDSSSMPWDPTQSPTQVKLVELLQFIAGRSYFKPPFRLALVISAWDQLKGEKTTPGKWLWDELPLLVQFLESNRRLFDYTMYGVSAQGGDYAQADQLAEMAPSERILVVGADVKNPHDLTEPLLWLMR
jgi:hypothetical protein